ncbi:carbohydrate ABC transporter substrate-binding protein, CUT1 family [Clostridium cavendishii DSM 21758]|uniref:Carbohydrate ABC transporter substrate-binding protein, CUT1 family n=1 Tax=Clostridium cavendishii DSM 21758 TaxID=1121302 RepID=A0A1M6HUV1_9CLOT|nr:extracellular solute-binding protein [Clostridium cavendishii]SHJ25999.1 carbohydrate ABC transporter substrate-binding protein, CUT1 family [Clostridium cavendishii DSM 21758]
MRLKKIVGLLMSGLIIGTMFAGCGKENSATAKDGGEQVELKFWHTYSDTEDEIFNKKVLPEWNKKHPNIKIKAIRMPTDGLKQQVVQGVAGKSCPDLMRMDIVWVPEFANTGALKNVNDMDGFKEIKDKSFEAPMNTNKWKDKYYGVPLNTNTKAAIYNKKVLAEAGSTEAPKTFDELVDIAYKIKAKHKNGVIGIAGNDAWGMGSYFMSLGGKYTDEKYSKADGYINSPESVAALEKLVKLNEDGILGKCLNGGQPTTWDGIKKDGEYLMIDDGPWFYSILKDEAKNKTINTTLPKGSAGNISVVGGEDLVMFNNTKHPKEVWEFMKYLTSTEPQKTMAIEAGINPTNLDAANDSKVLENPVMKVYGEQLKTAWARVPHPKWEEMNDKISKGFEKAMKKKATSKEVLDDLAKQMDKLLQEK